MTRRAKDASAGVHARPSACRASGGLSATARPALAFGSAGNRSRYTGRAAKTGIATRRIISGKSGWVR